MPSNRKKRKTPFYLSLGALAAIIGCGPQLASFFIESGWSKHIKAHNVHLSWFGMQSAETLSLFDETGQMRYSCDTIITDTSLWDLILWKLQPSKKSSLSFLKTSTIEGGYIVCHFFENDTVVFKNISLHVKRLQNLNITASSTTIWKGHTGHIGLEGTYDSQDLTAKLNLDSVPFLEPDELLDLSCSLRYQEDKSIASIEATSQNFALSAQALLESNTIQLQKPASCTLSLSEKALEGLYYNLPFLEKIGLQQLGYVRIDMANLHLPLNDWKKSALQATATLQNLEFSDLSLNNLNLNIETLQEKVHLSLSAEGKDFALSPVLLTWNTALTLDSPLTITSERYLGGTVKINELHIPSLEDYKNLVLKGESHFTVIPLSLGIDIETMHKMTLGVAYKKMYGNFLISSEWKEGVLKAHMHSPSFDCFSNIQASIDFNRAKKRCILDGSAHINEGSIIVHADLDDFNTSPLLDFSDAHIKAHIQAENLPPTKDLSLPLLGSPLSGSLSLDSTISKQTCDIKGTFSQGYMKGSLVISNNLLHIENPSLEINLIEIPLPSIKWTAPPSLHITVSQLAMPLLFTHSGHGILDRLPSRIGDWKESTFSLKAELQPTEFKTQSAQLSVNSAICSLEHTQADGPLSIQVNTVIHNEKQKGSLQAHVTWDEKTASTDALIDLTGFPSAVLDIASHCYGYDDLFSALLGGSCSGTIKASIYNKNGPFSCNLSSPLSHIHTSGSLNQGALTLEEPFYAQCQLTEKLSELLLKEINLFSISSITAEHPISLSIDPQGVYIPITSFDPSALSIPHMHIELGKLSCRNEGNINIALGLLKSQKRAQDKLDLWFAPADCRIEKGVIDLERTEILIADTYDVALWGSLNLVQDFVDMTLGLTADCLKHSFGIKGLPKDYVLRIPMKGPMDDVRINASSATAKIALLLAWQQKALAGAITGGPAGALFGEVLNSLGTLPDANEKAPPAKKPFPWENTDKRTSHSQHKKTIHPHDKPLKQLFKAIR